MRLVLDKQTMEKQACLMAGVLHDSFVCREERARALTDYYDRIKSRFSKYGVGVRGMLSICHSLDYALSLSEGDCEGSSGGSEGGDSFNPFYDLGLLKGIASGEQPGLFEVGDQGIVSISVESEPSVFVSRSEVSKEDEMLFMEIFVDAVSTFDLEPEQIGEVFNRFLGVYAINLVRAGCVSEKTYRQLVGICERLSRLDFKPYKFGYEPVVASLAWVDAFRSDHVLYFQHVLNLIRSVSLEGKKLKEPYPVGACVSFVDGGTGVVAGIVPSEWMKESFYGYAVSVGGGGGSLRFCRASDFFTVSLG